MTVTEISADLLRSLSPIEGLKPDNLNALVKKTRLQDVAAGRSLFQVGDTEKKTIYVLKGDVELRSSGKVVRIISGGTDAARYPLAPVLPRKVDARARTNCQYIAIDSDLLDVMLTWDQTGSYEVSELQTDQSPDADDWMTMLLKNKAFHRIPPANIQAVFMRMERLDRRAGDVIIKQGDEGDYFYAIINGRCAVTRETPLNKEGIKLAELRVGDTFGEEALISQAKRNATVTMLMDGALMRLNKEDFNTLLKEPMLKWVTYAEAQKMVTQGGVWLDVRLPSEFDNFHQEGAINIPLYFIRLKLKTLDKDAPYIVCCDTGRRSSAAAFILSERGFNVYVLKDGLTGI